MSWPVAIVLIVLISAMAKLIRSRHRVEHGVIRDRYGAESPSVSYKEQALQREVEDLRERIKVLERITTDANSTNERHSKAIADEIESLRGQ